MKVLVCMNIVIIILSIIDTILIYIIDIRMGHLIPEILFDVLGGILISYIWLKIEDYYDKTKQNLKWTSFFYLWFVLLYIVVAIIRKELKFIQPICSPVIPVCILYYVICIKEKVER